MGNRYSVPGFPVPGFPCPRIYEFDLRYNTRDMHGERAALILKGGEGRRLTYRRIDPLAA